MKKLLLALVTIASLSGCAHHGVIVVDQQPAGYYYNPYYRTYEYHEHYVGREYRPHNTHPHERR